MRLDPNTYFESKVRFSSGSSAKSHLSVRQFLGDHTGFEACGLLGGTDDVFFGIRVEQPCHPEGAGVGLIDCDAPADGDDIAFEGVFGLAHRTLITDSESIN